MPSWPIDENIFLNPFGHPEYSPSVYTQNIGSIAIPNIEDCE
jgi:hypothetical protein